LDDDTEDSYKLKASENVAVAPIYQHPPSYVYDTSGNSSEAYVSSYNSEAGSGDYMFKSSFIVLEIPFVMLMHIKK
jgi:hypothetical protein